MPHILPYPYSG